MSSTSTTEYDIIIAGGGTAGGVIAGRLAAADPSLKILILEAGGHTKDDVMHTQTARYLTHLVPTSKTVKFYVGKQSEHLGGRAPIVPVGSCLGGGSSVNFAMYTRAGASDYDDWELEYGNPGWGSKDLLPLLKKSETYQVKSNEATHGYDGPLKVSYGGAFTNVGKAFLEVGAQYDRERGISEDANDLATANALARWPKWISGINGRRSDVPHHFLYNQVDNRNLVIDVGCIVKRVIFEGKRAVGVEYSHNPQIHPDANVQALQIARAKKLVIVSAGAFGSPQILERSGVGAPKVLDGIGVDIVVDLPGVGENYQDHQSLFVPYVASDEAETIDGIVRSEEDEIQKWGELWKNEGTGLLAHNGVDATGKFRPSAVELEAIGPAFKPRWESFYQGRGQDKPVYILACLSLLVGDIATAPVRKYFTLGGFLAYPSSIGYVHCTTSDANALPDFDPGFLSTEDDVAIARAIYKKTREFARRMWPYRGEYAPGHPQFPEGSSAALGEERMPVDVNAKELEYSAEDDEAITRHLQAAVGTTWHSLGTCAMKPRDNGGVVDSRLNVYGTEGLKVADMSIAPGNVGSNTYSTALVIGEKAAVIIGEELGLTNV